jgi:mRNA interferase MazF
MDDIQSGEIWWADLSGLPGDSVVNVSQVLTLDRSFLTEHAGTLSARLQGLVDADLRFVLQL